MKDEPRWVTEQKVGIKFVLICAAIFIPLAVIALWLMVLAASS